jgi:ComF family protein
MNNWLKNNHSLNFKRLLGLAFKQNCLLCSASKAKDIGICHDCLADLPYVSPQSCAQCGLYSDSMICGSCLSSKPSFDQTRAIFTYDFPINTMMHRYKYGSQIQLSQAFGQLLAQKIDLSTVDLIIPMPMHPARLKERGFNQALEIAKVLAQPPQLNYKAVVRTKNTLPQASLPLKVRAKNIRNAFQVNQTLSGLHIAIIDDVMTTGASLNELAKTLKKADAAHVECWVIARTLSPN